MELIELNDAELKSAIEFLQGFTSTESESRSLEVNGRIILNVAVKRDFATIIEEAIELTTPVTIETTPIVEEVAIETNQVTNEDETPNENITL